MLSPQEKTIITDSNAKYLGVSVDELMDNAGKGIVKEVINKYGKDKSVGIVCGLGNNGGDGFSSALQLQESGLKVSVYLIGRASDIKSESAKNFWEKIYNLKSENLSVKQDAFAEDVEQHDIYLEALLGTGIDLDGRSKLNKRFRDVITRLVRMKGDKIAVDAPVPGYNPDMTISLVYPKTKGAVTVSIGLPKEVDLYCGPGEVKVLAKPKKDSYKTQNGEILLFGGSDTYHGAPLMAAHAASKIVGSVYFYSTPENQELIKNMKSEICEFIAVKERDLQKYAEYADTFLIGPGLEDNLVNRALIDYLLRNFPDKTKVIDAYAIAMADKSLIRGAVLTPHRGELRHIFGQEIVKQKNVKSGGGAIEGKVRQFAKKHGCYINVKGHISLLFGPDGEFKMNKSGNPGMAKGGTGDVLSGITAAFLTKNDPWLAMCAAAFVNGAAGDLASKQYGYNYSATDLIPKIQEVIKWSNEF